MTRCVNKAIYKPAAIFEKVNSEISIWICSMMAKESLLGSLGSGYLPRLLFGEDEEEEEIEDDNEDDDDEEDEEEDEVGNLDYEVLSEVNQTSLNELFYDSKF
ncbi:MAG: hypothetical protein EZS28_028507 [Streblomastix strix]|uniref:Uncharacterized protein n=1 Tax=Streblomastix strix TaxID=222440 RepID=A0A5J4V035_9EUKA|nr:MAG: hypothetical protein EZS28_028507 [Streblomastix strix]